MEQTAGQKKRLRIIELIKPYRGQLILGIFAVLGEGIADLLGPWPLKVVIDNVVKSQQGHGWLNSFILSVAGDDKMAILRLATFSLLAFAMLGAVCAYSEKSITTSVGQH